MKTLKTLSNEELIQTTKTLVTEERRLTTEILWHLHEIQNRRLFAQQGYGSLFEYAVRELGYSEAAAGRRVSAMRLLVEIPEVETALAKGDVSISTLCTLQSFFHRKETPTSKEEKKELVLALQGKSRRECEKHLASIAPEALVPKERERAVTATQTEIRLIADDSLMAKLQKIRELDAHVNSDVSYLELFHRMADLALRKLDPLTPKSTRVTPPAERTRLPSTNPRFISAPLRRAIWLRDQGLCTYNSRDGRVCRSRFALEIDHKTPLAHGGKTEIANLQLLCRSHNRYKAVAQLDERAMRPYLRA